MKLRKVIFINLYFALTMPLTRSLSCRYHMTILFYKQDSHLRRFSDINPKPGVFSVQDRRAAKSARKATALRQKRAARQNNDKIQSV